LTGIAGMPVNCECCPAKIHQAAPILFGPPDVFGRSRRMWLCRTCYRRLVKEIFPQLRARAVRDRQRAREAA